MVQFLRTKTGYCEQFAGTFAAMARYLGIPARVAVGFTPGTQDPKNPNLWRVQTSDAHAWPELYLPGLGWWPFEPTPSSPGAGGSDFVTRPALVVNAAGDPQAPVLPEATPADSGDLNIDTADSAITASGDGSTGGLHLDHFVIPGVVVLLVGGAVGYLVGVPFAKRRRRRRRREAPDPRDAVRGHVGGGRRTARGSRGVAETGRDTSRDGVGGGPPRDGARGLTVERARRGVDGRGVRRRATVGRTRRSRLGALRRVGGRAR